MKKTDRIIVNGTFDILHPGHLKLLRAAKALGSFLLVAIDSDKRVQNLKGANRPINSASKRREMLLGIVDVNEVVIFDSDAQLEDYMTDFGIDTMVKGSDYIGKPIVGKNYVDNIYFVELTDDSTTKIIERISNR